MNNTNQIIPPINGNRINFIKTGGKFQGHKGMKIAQKTEKTLSTLRQRLKKETLLRDDISFCLAVFSETMKTTFANRTAIEDYTGHTLGFYAEFFFQCGLFYEESIATMHKIAGFEKSEIQFKTEMENFALHIEELLDLGEDCSDYEENDLEEDHSESMCNLVKFPMHLKNR